VIFLHVVSDQLVLYTLIFSIFYFEKSCRKHSTVAVENKKKAKHCQPSRAEKNMYIIDAGQCIRLTLLHVYEHSLDYSRWNESNVYEVIILIIMFITKETIYKVKKKTFDLLFLFLSLFFLLVTNW
jgi:hypothetical protein